MDSHYHQVMEARNKAADSGVRLYFAYSTVLDREAFEKWRNEHSYQFFQLPAGQLAKAVDVDLVFDFLSRWWGGRVAGLADKKEAVVYGRLFEISAKDWPIIQHKEGVVTGMCIERPIKVLVDGKEVEATAFTTNPGRATLNGEISQNFIQALVRGAQQSGLPEDYITRLRGLGL